MSKMIVYSCSQINWYKVTLIQRFIIVLQINWYINYQVAKHLAHGYHMKIYCSMTKVRVYCRVTVHRPPLSPSLLSVCINFTKVLQNQNLLARGSCG